jgi:hypothetical protein
MEVTRQKGGGGGGGFDTLELHTNVSMFTSCFFLAQETMPINSVDDCCDSYILSWAESVQLPRKGRYHRTGIVAGNKPVFELRTGIGGVTARGNYLFYNDQYEGWVLGNDHQDYSVAAGFAHSNSSCPPSYSYNLYDSSTLAFATFDVTTTCATGATGISSSEIQNIKDRCKLSCGTCLFNIGGQQRPADLEQSRVTCTLKPGKEAFEGVYNYMNYDATYTVTRSFFQCFDKLEDSPLGVAPGLLIFAILAISTLALYVLEIFILCATFKHEFAKARVYYNQIVGYKIVKWMSRIPLVVVVVAYVYAMYEMNKSCETTVHAREQGWSDGACRCGEIPTPNSQDDVTLPMKFFGDATEREGPGEGGEGQREGRERGREGVG